MQIFFIFLILILGGGAVFSLISGYIAYKSIFLRKPDTTRSMEAEIDGIDSRLTGHTRDSVIMIPLQAAKKAWYEKNTEKVSITARDGIPLTGYVWNVEKNQLSGTTALLVHGYSDSAAGMAYLAQEYHGRGIRTLSVNCRAHGDSGGKKTGMGFWEAHDLVCWIEFLQRFSGDEVQIILHGVSMGAVTICQYCGLLPKNRPDQEKNIRAMVIDCGFSDYTRQVKNQLSFMLPGKFQALARNLIVAGSSFVCKLENGFSFGDLSPRRSLALKNLNKLEKVPLVIFHGKADVLVRPEMALELYEAAREPKKLVLVENAPHIGSYFYGKEEYFKTIFDMLNKKNRVEENA